MFDLYSLKPQLKKCLPIPTPLADKQPKQSPSSSSLARLLLVRQTFGRLCARGSRRGGGAARLRRRIHAVLRRQQAQPDQLARVPRGRRGGERGCRLRRPRASARREGRRRAACQGAQRAEGAEGVEEVLAAGERAWGGSDRGVEVGFGGEHGDCVELRVAQAAENVAHGCVIVSGGGEGYACALLLRELREALRDARAVTSPPHRRVGPDSLREDILVHMNSIEDPIRPMVHKVGDSNLNPRKLSVHQLEVSDCCNILRIAT